MFQDREKTHLSARKYDYVSGQRETPFYHLGNMTMFQDREKIRFII